MQNSLFSNSGDVDPGSSGKVGTSGAKVLAAPLDAAHKALAEVLRPQLRLGTSSWNYAGWTGKIWDRDYSEALLSKHGLSAYAQHPLLRTVSLDRGFYRPLSVGQYTSYAAQVPDDFRFVVKAPSIVTDALVRGENGRGMQANPAFLSPDLAVREFVQPALDGLKHKLGALVFQLSPLPMPMLERLPAVLERLRSMLRVMPRLQPIAPDGVLAVEVRDPEFLMPAWAPDFARLLGEAGATCCLGLHAKMPPIVGQLPMLRALWPGPLVCRWNLHRRHGIYGYEEAKQLYAPFDHMVDPDVETRLNLARVIDGTTAAGHCTYITISNKAEGCAPLSVVALAEAVREQRRTSSTTRHAN